MGSLAAAESYEARRTTEPTAPCPSPAKEERRQEPPFEIPAEYARRFPHLLGMEPSTREGTRKTASQSH